MTAYDMRIIDCSSDVCSSDLLVIETPDDVPVVLGDDTRLRQILLNLLPNAIKLTPGGGTVVLRAGLTADRSCERTAERRVGKECVGSCRSRGTPVKSQNTTL